jgi:hypothetical protein
LRIDIDIENDLSATFVCVPDDNLCSVALVNLLPREVGNDDCPSSHACPPSSVDFEGVQQIE